MRHCYALRHDFNDTWGFRQNMRYEDRAADKRHIRPSQLQSDGRTLTRGTVRADVDMTQTALDSYVEGTFKTGTLDQRLIAGVDWLRLRSLEQEWTGMAPNLDLLNPVYAPVAEPTVLGDRIGPYRLDSVGLYLQDQIKFDERWLLTLSGRYDRARATVASSYGDTLRRTDGSFTGRAGLTWLRPDGWAPYISYGTSFQPVIGAFDGFDAVPTRGRQWEAGVKYQPGSRKLLFTAAVFDLEKRDILATNPVTGQSEQVGLIRSRGLELEVKGEVMPGLAVTAGYTQYDVKGRKGDTWYVHQGKIPIMTPERMASLWLDHRLRSTSLAGLQVGFGARYVGRRWDDAENTQFQGGYTLFDASLRYNLAPQWRLALNVTNLLDKRYYTSNVFSNWLRGERRTATATLTYSW